MSNLTYKRQINKLLIGFLESINPNLIIIYYSPTYNGMIRELSSHYARATIRVCRNSKGEYYPIYRNPVLECETLGNNSQNSTRAEKIAYTISTSNMKEKIIKQIDTEDRLKLWLDYKDYSYRIASCFLYGDKLLEQEFKEGIITNSVCDLTYTTYQTYYLFYKIIDRKWKKIKNIFSPNKKFSFNSSVELFEEIICKNLENDYSKCLLPQVKLRAKDKFKTYDLYKELSPFIDSDSDLDFPNHTKKQNYLTKKQKLDGLTAPKLSNEYWHRKIINFLYSEKSKDSEIKYFFKRRKELGSELFKTMRSRKFPKPPDCTMINGVIYKGSHWRSINRQVNPARKPNKS